MEEKPSQTIPLGLVWQDVEIISKRKTSVSTTKKEEKNLNILKPAHRPLSNT
jgi:hypothetical protein